MTMVMMSMTRMSSRRCGEDDTHPAIACAELSEALNVDMTDATLLGRAKRFVHFLVKRVGFWGILLCASIPNPLFDLAGITCGHFLVPFGTFFGATLIGKAIIKMHIQVIHTNVCLTTCQLILRSCADALCHSGLLRPHAESPARVWRRRSSSWPLQHNQHGQAAGNAHPPVALTMCARARRLCNRTGPSSRARAGRPWKRRTASRLSRWHGSFSCWQP
jgi:hypothetical protein